ncbi:MAG TPA: RES family NAD+ phosphorylase [Solirubrobacteraceae bacterium]|nr:RES family NAD+ phosphorylase [Solirubrobacteraceae bacterium]
MFPEHVAAAGTVMHRIHRAAFGAWWFDGSETWRFNPTGAPGLGSCYLAETAVAGLLEVFKGVRVVDDADVRVRAHFVVTLDKPLRLADVGASGANGFGVNGEIHSTTDYALTQRWASAFALAGFAGVRYLCRSDPGMNLVAYALFDHAGEARSGRWPDGVDRPIGDEVLREAEQFGLIVRPAP